MRRKKEIEHEYLIAQTIFGNDRLAAEHGLINSSKVIGYRKALEWVLKIGDDRK